MSDKDTDTANSDTAEAARPAARPAQPARPAARARSGRGVAWLALLLALAAVALSSWDHLAARGWVPALTDVPEPREVEPAAPGLDEDAVDAMLADRLSRLQRTLDEKTERLAERLEDQESRTGDLRDRLRRDLEREADARERALDETGARVTELRRGVAALAEDLATATPPDTQEWRVAEAGYLLRIANERARLERDIPGALGLLRAAERILSEIDDYRLVPVRESLMKAKAELAAQPRVNRVSLYLELERAVWAVNQWELAGPEAFTATTESEAPENWREALQQRLLGLVEIRRDRGGQQVLPLTPDDRAALQHNIQLKLLHAQLALLRSEQDVWSSSLAAAADWAESAGDQRGGELAESLRGLADMLIRPDVPDISAPLRLLDGLHLRDEEDDT